MLLHISHICSKKILIYALIFFCNGYISLRFKSNKQMRGGIKISRCAFDNKKCMQENEKN